MTFWRRALRAVPIRSAAGSSTPVRWAGGDVKIPMYVLFWTVLAPVILLTVLSLLIYPVGYFANAIWPDIKPFGAKLAL